MADIVGGTAITAAIEAHGLPLDPAEAVAPQPVPGGNRHGVDPSDLETWFTAIALPGLLYAAIALWAGLGRVS
ncbi:hypothetical protein [Nocardia nepalensis]|uniref:hypothetical protein n=1 Tax=Nocardia nepalensis TaxID=3375448 RepID=UPI003B67A012